MRKIFSLLIIMLLLVACDSDSNSEHYPSLQIVNGMDKDFRVITAVELVGYDFENLNIEKGESKTFELTDGIPGGNEDVLIKFRINAPYILPGTERNFEDGETTTIVMKECNSGEDCPASWYYL